MDDITKSVESSLTLDESQKYEMEHLGAYQQVEQNLSRLSKRDVARVILALIAPTSKEVERLDRLNNQPSKLVYSFAFRCLSVKFASMFKKMAERREEKK